MIAKGLYNPNIELPLVPLSDGAGEVVAVGNDVTEFSVGDRVTSVFWQDWNKDNKSRTISTGSDAAGVLSEFAVLPKEAVLPIPDYMTYQEASTIPCAAVTAWTCINAANITSGDSVLLLGTGGVSILALQILKAMQANVIITSSSNEKLSKAIKRLKFDEHFFLQLFMAIRKKSIKSLGTKSLNDIGPYFRTISESLNFELTGAQKKVIQEIHADIKSNVPMNRLLQGDVGSGKTLVALAAMLTVVETGAQAALLVPTEVLARQHHEKAAWSSGNITAIRSKGQ